MKNVGLSFIKLAIRIFLAYGLYAAVIPYNLVYVLACVFILVMGIATLIYITVDFDSERSTLYGSITPGPAIEFKTPESYLFNVIIAIFDVLIIYFLLASPMTSLVYSLLFIALLMFVYEHQKAIKKFKNRYTKNEQTNSMHR